MSSSTRRNRSSRQTMVATVTRGRHTVSAETAERSNIDRRNKNTRNERFYPRSHECDAVETHCAATTWPAERHVSAPAALYSNRNAYRLIDGSDTGQIARTPARRRGRRGAPGSRASAAIPGVAAQRRLHADGLRRGGTGDVFQHGPRTRDPGDAPCAHARTRRLRRVHARGRRDQGHPGERILALASAPVTLYSGKSVVFPHIVPEPSCAGRKTFEKCGQDDRFLILAIWDDRISEARAERVHVQ